MRDREEIERELDERREDLAQNLEQLKDVVLDKVEHVKDAVNVPKRAREAVAAGKQRAVEAARQVEEAARRHPMPVAVAAGVLAAGGLILLRARSVRLRRSRR